MAATPAAGSERGPRLLVLRHAKAASPPETADRDRPLTARGHRQAAALAPVVQRLDPDLVLCSPALRTRQTLEGLGLAVRVAYEEHLYHGSADDLISRVQDVVDAARVLLVGHNPAVHHLVLEVTGGERVPAFPPASLAVLAVDLPPDEWWRLAPGTGRLAALHLPA